MKVSKTALVSLLLSGTTVSTFAEQQKADQQQVFLRSNIKEDAIVYADADDADGKKKKDDKPKPDAGFRLGKGVKCGGVSFTGKGRGVKCAGGVKFGAAKKKKSSSSTTSSLGEYMDDVKISLHEHYISDGNNYLLTKNDFLPSDAVRQDIDSLEDIDLQDGMEDDLEGGSVGFGGFGGVQWGCKVKFFVDRGAVTKLSECGFKAMKGMGMKDMTEYEEHQDENENASVADDFLEEVNELTDHYVVWGSDGKKHGGRGDKKKPKPDAGFCFESGVKCGGAQFNGKGGGVKCVGGSKFGMARKKKHTLTDENEDYDDQWDGNTYTVDSIAQGMRDHMHEGYLLDVESFTPSDDAIEEMQNAENEMQSALKDCEDENGVNGCGKSKTVEFGGFGSVKWGCKVKFGFKDGKVFKVGACGMKAMKASGLKPNKEDSNYLQQEMEVTTIV